MIFGLAFFSGLGSEAPTRELDLSENKLEACGLGPSTLSPSTLSPKHTGFRV